MGHVPQVVLYHFLAGDNEQIVGNFALSIMKSR